MRMRNKREVSGEGLCFIYVYMMFLCVHSVALCLVFTSFTTYLLDYIYIYIPMRRFDCQAVHSETIDLFPFFLSLPC